MSRYDFNLLYYVFAEILIIIVIIKVLISQSERPKERPNPTTMDKQSLPTLNFKIL